MQVRVRGSVLTLAVLALVLSGLARAADPPSPTLPDSPAGRRVAAFFDAYRAGTEERLAAFFSGAIGPEALKQRPAAERARRLVAMKSQIGDVKVRRADAPSPEQLVIVTEGAGNRFDKWIFSFGPAPEAYLLGIGVDEADESEAVPDPGEFLGLELLRSGESRAGPAPRRSSRRVPARRGGCSGRGAGKV